VVQKYIENPLIINRRKFDIRQWVLVEDYNPPKIWFYGEFYLRFCLEEYNPAKLSNKYAHLTNNSIQKYNSKINAEELARESMWTQEQLMQYVEAERGEGQFKEIVAKMKEIVVATILSTQDQVYGRRNSFELIGYDFMIDEQLAPWLIEVNSSPSMDYSTNVTRRLVKMVLEDTVKVVLDLKKKKSKKKTAGLFRCIYDAETPYEFKRYRMPEE
jgi:tubulin monoglycylase TTLL3/8